MSTRLFYTGPAINTEMLLVMLENHGIVSTQVPIPGESEDPDDLNRMVQVFVPESDYERARQLFYAERDDEI